MSRVVKTMLCTGAQVYRIDLRPAGSTGNGPYNKCGYLRVVVLAASTTKVFVQPLVFSDGATPSTPSLPGSLVAGTDIDWLELDTATERSAEFGQRYAPGYTPQAQGTPVATHLAIGSQSGDFIVAILGDY